MQRHYAISLVLVLTCISEIATVGGQQLPEEARSGRWELLRQTAGLSAMHMTLTHNGTVIMYDQTTNGCPDNDIGRPTPQGCWAHSVEYDIANNTVRPMHLLTNSFCSSGAFLNNGTLVITGGWQAGQKVVSYFNPCVNSTCDWIQAKTPLLSNRWYASNQILPDGRIIVVGGRRSFNYEFIPRNPSDTEAFQLPFLVKTNTMGEENNLYPFLYLVPDGNLFIFANKDSILLDYKQNQVIKTFPTMPGGGARNYPSSASFAMLPLESSNNFTKLEILICGGAPDGAFKEAEKNHTYVKALENCGRMEITSHKPQWQMENMPGPRVMGDMLILPTGKILIINGAQNGTAGWENGEVPAFSPFLYTPTEAIGKRFTVMSPANISRMYHSTALVLPDGRVLVAGSNPHQIYKLAAKPFPTDLRVEAYIPPYLHPVYDYKRPAIAFISTREIKYGSRFNVSFSVSSLSINDIYFHAYAPPFSTHTMSMNQRMLSLAAATAMDIVKGEANSTYSVSINAPPSSVVAPPGYYLLTVVNEDIPSEAEWICFIN